MSNINQHFFKQVYNSYSEALKAYIENELGRGGKKKVAKLLSDNPDNEKEVHSKQVQVGRWTNDDPEKRKEPLDHTKDEINRILNISISEESPGNWVISRTKESAPNPNVDEAINAIEKLIDEARSRHKIFDIPDTPRGRVLQGIQEDIISLVLKLDHLIQQEKDRSD